MITSVYLKKNKLTDVTENTLILKIITCWKLKEGKTSTNFLIHLLQKIVGGLKIEMDSFPSKYCTSIVYADDLSRQFSVSLYWSKLIGKIRSPLHRVESYITLSFLKSNIFLI